MKETKKIDRQAADLRKKISALTGKTPDSEDPRYLAQRLAFYEKQRAAGIDVSRRKTGTSVFSISMPTDAGIAVERILQREKIGASDLGRRALAEWAANNGYKAEAETIYSTDS